MRKTLFRQLIIYMMLFFIVLCAACYVAVEFYFDDYYYAKQKEVLRSRINELAAQYNENGIETLETQIDYYYSEYGVSLHFYDNQTNQLYSASYQGMGKQSIYSAMINENVDKFFISTSEMGHGAGRADNTSWLSYLTATQDGNLLLGRISYESMNSVVMLVQQFVLYLGAVITVAFILFAFFFSRSMSKPLRELNDIATQMGKLNFSMRYKGNRRDEIGHLGKTLNELTTKLENTITQLQGELSKERTLEKMRTQFTAQLSHELQTPLSVIKGYTEALIDNIFIGQEVTDAYDILDNETEKISRMVDDLLDLSQMEAGAYVVRKKNFDIKKLLKKTYDRYSSLPNEKQFSINMHDSYPKETMYYGDSLRLEQVIRNLLSNAIKHVSINGNINITLSKKENMAQISIENEGEHIAESDLPHIFDSYYQGKTEKRGYGLGLAIAHHIIKLHEGQIRVHNTKDGVLFMILLP